MAFNNNHIKELHEVIELIKEKKAESKKKALEKFDKYLDVIQEIGPFDSTNWHQDWRKLVWKFGEEFKTINPQPYLNLTNDKIGLSTTNNKEVLEFIRSEIAFNYLPSQECINSIITLIDIYPLNSELRHTLGHFYKSEGELLKSINEYKLALKIEENNKEYLKSRFNAEYLYLNELISKSKYTEGQAYLKNLFEEHFYLNRDTIYHNALIDFQARFQDHLIFKNKFKNLEKEFKKKMQKELDSERKRIIEVVGFFSGIVAFILSTVSIGGKFSFIEAICFIIGLGLVLILFSVSLSILFNTNKKPLLEDKKFWILLIGLISLFTYLFFIDSIASISKILGQ